MNTHTLPIRPFRVAVSCLAAGPTPGLHSPLSVSFVGVDGQGTRKEATLWCFNDDLSPVIVADAATAGKTEIGARLMSSSRRLSALHESLAHRRGDASVDDQTGVISLPSSRDFSLEWGIPRDGSKVTAMMHAKRTLWLLGVLFDVPNPPGIWQVQGVADNAYITAAWLESLGIFGGLRRWYDPLAAADDNEYDGEEQANPVDPSQILPRYLPSIVKSLRKQAWPGSDCRAHRLMDLFEIQHGLSLTTT